MSPLKHLVDSPTMQEIRVAWLNQIDPLHRGPRGSERHNVEASRRVGPRNGQTSGTGARALPRGEGTELP
jgi:hypothetical protein